MRIVLHRYTTDWAARFESERDRLTPLLPPGAIVEHLGSTSVPGLAAKDIVDIMIGLPDFAAWAAKVVPRIVASGYIYLSKYEDVMPFRRFFHWSENEVRRFHIHMVGIGTTFWQEHLLFRDHLRAQPEARVRYEALKRELTTREWTGMNDYADAKGEFIRAMLAEASARARDPAP